MNLVKQSVRRRTRALKVALLPKDMELQAHISSALRESPPVLRENLEWQAALLRELKATTATNIDQLLTSPALHRRLGESTYRQQFLAHTPYLRGEVADFEQVAQEEPALLPKLTFVEQLAKKLAAESGVARVRLLYQHVEDSPPNAGTWVESPDAHVIILDGSCFVYEDESDLEVIVAHEVGHCLSKRMYLNHLERTLSNWMLDATLPAFTELLASNKRALQRKETLRKESTQRYFHSLREHEHLADVYAASVVGYDRVCEWLKVSEEKLATRWQAFRDRNPAFGKGITHPTCTERISRLRARLGPQPFQAKGS